MQVASVSHDGRTVRAAHEQFLSTGRLRPGIDPVVAASWRRSLSNGVDPDRAGVDVELDPEALAAYRVDHPLAATMPLVHRMLVEAAVDDGLAVAVCDDVGRLLWVESSRRIRPAVERAGFVAGAVWREERVGTNAPGTALATGQAVRVLGAEHFSRTVQSLSCAAAPVRDLRTGAVLGALDVTGGRAAGSGVVLNLVRSVAAAMEQHLLAGQGPARGVVADARHDLQVLGPPCVGPARSPLSLRHAEILLLLAEHADGLSAEQLAALLTPAGLSTVTVRAEVSRLRRAVGPLVAASRPYRLARALRTDLGAVRSALVVGDVPAALAAYHAPLLPRSTAPGVERLRAELSAEVRWAVLASEDVALLEAWTRHPDAADDLEAWTVLAQQAAPGSPQQARARAHVAVLDAELR